MKSRHWFPLDLSALLSIPLVVLGISFLMGALFPAISWFRHLTGLPWLWALGIATGTSFLGTLLLFLAKLPQYRAGIFLRVGSHHLPPREQRLYRVSFWLIVPSIVVLFALLPAAAKAESSDELDALTKEAAKNYSTDEGRRYFDQFQKSIMPVFSKALHTCSESMPDTKEPASFVFLIAADGTVTRVLYSKDPFGECLGTKLSAIKSVPPPPHDAWAVALGAANHAKEKPKAVPDKPIPMKNAEAMAAYDKAIAPAIAKARATYPAVKKRFLAGLPRGQTFLVRLPLIDKDGKREDSFVLVESIEKGDITGTIDSDLTVVAEYKRGQKITFSESKIDNWVIVRADGSEEGNYVGKFLDTYQPK